jgi:photosystem II stability/assembly factor-like uncharacterized protein
MRTCKWVLPAATLLLLLAASCTSAPESRDETPSRTADTKVVATSPSPSPESDNTGGASREKPPINDPNNPVAPGFWPLSVAFWDASNGLLAGQLYSCRGCDQHEGAVAVTKDGGETWRMTYTGSTQISSLRVIAGGTAVATLGYRRPSIIASADWGHAWKRWPGSDGLTLATSASHDEGWAASHYGSGLVRWIGTQWVKTKDPCGGEIVDLSFPQDGGGVGWLACSYGSGAGNELKAIFETVDDGRTWEARTAVRPDKPSLSLGSGLGGSGYLQAISFLEDGTGWLVESRGTFYSTTDGGSTWTEHVGFQQPEMAFGSSAWRVNDALGFALIDRRHMVLHVTWSGGSSWSKVAVFRSPG